MKISRLMSTQHPDNVNIPFFSEKAVMEGEDEIKEAFYTFSHLGVDEQLWDAEGKEVDNFVVKKLLTRYENFFQRNILGQDKFLTLRVPNPNIEKSEGKILLETLHSIPRNFDLAQAFYHKGIAPLFEVVMPMCASEKDLLRVHEYYKTFVIKSQHSQIYNDDLKISQWVGELNPLDIRVTPLFETKEAILNADKYVEKYVQYEKIKELQRVWFARSDTALNYGSVSAVLLGKIGLQRLHHLQEKLSLPILPILGCGTAPFRGNFKPTNVEKMAQGYPSVQTFTLQSAFKYDYPVKQVMEGIERIKNTKRKEPRGIDEEFAQKMIHKIEEEYQKMIPLLAEKINLLTTYVPERRKRKLHVGLFGYARGQGKIKLPRAIRFVAALCSLGLPPEILGLSNLTKQELEKIREPYPNIDKDLAEALQYLNKKNMDYFPKEIKKRVLKAAKLFNFETNEEHQHLTSEIFNSLRKRDFNALPEEIINAGRIRGFLG